MPTRQFPLIGLLLIGCNGSDGSGFSNEGTYNVNDFLSESDTGSFDTEDTGDTVPEGTPVIDSFTATIDDDYPGYDFVFALEATYSDDDDNVDGGYIRCVIEVDSGNSQYCINDDAYEEGKLPIDGLNPFDESGTIYVYLDPGTYDEDQTFYFEVSLIDTDGNESATVGAFVE